MLTLEQIKCRLSSASKVFVLTDETLAALWLPEMERWLGVEDAEEIVLDAGEQHKNIYKVMRVWNRLHKAQADRDAIMINLGGGMITDLGGFAAATYLRGIPFINVPTTLLGMVDASLGGKNGINLGAVKNQIGTFAEPLEVLVNPIFLSTLLERDLLSGLAEMVKYGFIADPAMLKVDRNNYEQYLLRAGRIKKEIVAKDFREQGTRKVLNFGHTFGHAIEGYSLTSSCPLTHGESVTIGMWCALRVSTKLCGLPDSVLIDYEPKMRMLLSKSDAAFSKKEVEAIASYLLYDKKRKSGQGRFVLLKDLAEPVYDQTVPDELVRQAFYEVIELI